jgi:predicted nucleic acid-binding Zn ribbon protein
VSPRRGGDSTDSTGPTGSTEGLRSRWRSPRADRTVKVGESLAELTRQLGTGPPDALSAIFSRWSEVVGEDVAAHARPERLDGEALVVSVDSPAWASHLRTLAPRVISQLNDATGSDQVSRLVVRVKVPKKAPDLDI